MSYGMTCYNCEASIDGEDLAEVDRKAVEAKWCLGLMLSGQAYYTCPDCATGLLKATPLHRIYPELAPPPSPTSSC